jgi:hypothetical protein
MKEIEIVEARDRITSSFEKNVHFFRVLERILDVEVAGFGTFRKLLAGKFFRVDEAATCFLLRSIAIVFGRCSSNDLIRNISRAAVGDSFRPAFVRGVQR